MNMLSNRAPELSEAPNRPSASAEALRLPQQELNQLKNSVASTIGMTHEQLQSNQALLTTIKDQIESNQKLNDPTTPNIKELLQRGEIMKAIEIGFNALWATIFWDQHSQLFFSQFQEIATSLQAEKLKEKSDAELNFLREQFELHSSTASSTKRRIAYTKALSIIKDEQKSRHQPELKFEEKLAQEIEVGSVLLLNKKDAGFGGKLLQNLSDEDVDMTHVIVITQKWPPLRFAHSTGQKFSNPNTGGVESDISLLEYLQQYPADIIVTTPPEEKRKKALERVKMLASQQDQLSYSNTDALLGVIGKRETGSKSFNCGSYVAEILELESQDGNDLSIPNNWLSDKRLKPTYMFTFDPRNQGS